MNQSPLSADVSNSMTDWAVLAGAAKPHAERMKRKGKDTVEYTPPVDQARVARLREFQGTRMQALLARIEVSGESQGGETARECLRRLWLEQRYCAEAIDAAMAEYDAWASQAEPDVESILRDSDDAIARSQALLAEVEAEDGSDDAEARADAMPSPAATPATRRTTRQPAAGATA